MAESVVVGGAMARRAGCGGHAWALLQYLLGLQRLGLGVTFVDRAGQDEGRAEANYVASIMNAFGVERYVVLDGAGGVLAGLGRGELLDQVRGALLLNVMGYLDDETLLEVAGRRVFLDIDPGYGQMWRELGLADRFAGHDEYATIAQNLDDPACLVPTCGLDWITTSQPVVLDEWPVAPGGKGFTTVATWRSPYGTLNYEGKTYGSRVHEFRKFIELPRLVDADFELALDIHPDETRDLSLLEESGWRLVDPSTVAGNPWNYCSYIQHSKAEFCVAQNMYVETRSGWLSDRSLCYLASGKPVLAQETGFSRNYPTGEGLLAFTTLEEAAAGVEEIERNYERHSRAARALAEEYFDSDKVLPRLLENLAAVRA
jgi:hypothetical protein